MSKTKCLTLGLAGALFTATGAMAADLSVRAKAVQYVKACSLYGFGFYYIPGTDTCLRLGGYVQLDVNLNGANTGQPPWSQGDEEGTQSRDRNYFTTRSRVQFEIDTRTETEYGVVRAYANPRFQFTTGTEPSAGEITLDLAFVQFAGFTLGKAVSVFQTPWGAYGANNNTSSLLGGYDNVNGITQLTYTWEFGNGLSAQISAEDNRTINRAQLINSAQTFASAAEGGLLLGTGAYASAYGGNVAPDIVGNVRIDQAAFTAQLSAGLHNIHATYYLGPGGAAGIETNGHPSDQWGFAVQGGFQLKNLPTGPGDKLSLETIYTDGALKYLIGGTTGASFDYFGGSANPGSYQSIAVLSLADGVYGTGTSIEKTTGWGFRGAFVHNWSPNWESSLFGSYSRVSFNSGAASQICAVQTRAAIATGGGFANGYTCNPDFTIWQLGARTAWVPIQNLIFSLEGMYSVLDQNNTGSVVVGTTGTIGAFKPAATYDYKDQGIWAGSFRVRRTF